MDEWLLDREPGPEFFKLEIDMIGMLGILAGFAISLGVGLFAVPWVLAWLREDLGENAALPEEDRSGWKVGTLERAFFTVGVAAGMPGVLTAMILWIAAKMASSWGTQTEGIPDVEALRITALVGSLVSMMFALIGGGVVRMGWLLMG